MLESTNAVWSKHLDVTLSFLSLSSSRFLASFSRPAGVGAGDSHHRISRMYYGHFMVVVANGLMQLRVVVHISCS